MSEPAPVATHLLAERTREAPDEVVLVDVETGATWTHRELSARVGAWAGAFATLGVQPGDIVATMLPDQAEGIGAWLAAAFAGGIEAPINPQHTGELLRNALEITSPRVLVVAPEVLDGLDPADLRAAETIVVAGTAPTGGPGPAVSLEAVAAAATPIVEPPPAGPVDTAAIVFTSGTTGPSKGVIVPWGCLYQLVSWVPADAYGAGEAVFCALPMFHVAGKSAFTNALERRARLVYRPKFSADAFLDDVRSTGCVMANVVGPMLSFLHETPARADDGDNPLRVVACGPMIPEVEAFRRRFGVEVVTCYGMTEIGSVLTTDYDHGPWSSCGRVRRDAPRPEIRIVDAEDRDVAPGSVGELVVRTSVPGAFSPGYLGDPEKTAEVWRNGWFHSGDALRVDEAGNHFLVDRYKDTIRRRGENVSSFEVEAIVGAFAGVHECAAVGVPGAHGDDDIVVFVIPATPRAVDDDALRAWVDARVPSHMRPAEYHVVDDMPRNATSLRVKKYELRRIARSARDGSAR